MDAPGSAVCRRAEFRLEKFGGDAAAGLAHRQFVMSNVVLAPRTGR